MSVYAYIGCRTTKERNARGKGISVYSVEKGRWELLQLLEGEVNPSYLCLNEAQNRLYSIHGDFCQVSSYEIHEDGTISHMNTVDTHGTNPVHLTLDPTGKWLFVANLQTGGVSVIPVNEDGSLPCLQYSFFQKIICNKIMKYLSFLYLFFCILTGSYKKILIVCMFPHL